MRAEQSLPLEVLRRDALPERRFGVQWGDHELQRLQLLDVDSLLQSALRRRERRVLQVDLL